MTAAVSPGSAQPDAPRLSAPIVLPEVNISVHYALAAQPAVHRYQDDRSSAKYSLDLYSLGVPPDARQWLNSAVLLPAEYRPAHFLRTISCPFFRSPSVFLHPQLLSDDRYSFFPTMAFPAFFLCRQYLPVMLRHYHADGFPCLSPVSTDRFAELSMAADGFVCRIADLLWNHRFSYDLVFPDYSHIPKRENIRGNTLPANSTDTTDHNTARDINTRHSADRKDHNPTWAEDTFPNTDHQSRSNNTSLSMVNRLDNNS